MTDMNQPIRNEKPKTDLKTSDFYYELPPELIAQEPEKKRDNSRLMVLDKETGETAHHRFYEITDMLKAGDCLVLNNTRVIPARIIGCRTYRRRAEGTLTPTEDGAPVELLLLRQAAGMAE